MKATSLLVVRVSLLNFEGQKWLSCNAKNDSSAQRDPWRTILADCWTEAPHDGVEREHWRTTPSCTVGGATCWRSFREEQRMDIDLLNEYPGGHVMYCCEAPPVGVRLIKYRE